MARQDYNRTAVLLHWIMAVSIFFLFISSWWMLGLPLPSGELRFREFPFQLHKNIGITLVLVVFLLIYVRFKHRPAAALDKGSWMHKLALADHIIIYGLILAVCVSGYLSSAHTRWDTTLWWLVDLPRIAEPDEDMNMFFSDIHLWTAWALLAVIAVHISGAVYHAFRNDGIVRRMLHW